MFKNNRLFNLAALLLIAANIFIWRAFVFTVRPPVLELDFLNVGQGDSQLIVLPGGAKVLIDGGPDARVLGALSEVLPPLDRYIDLVVITHPQLDHFGGLIDVLKNYEVGAVVDNGRKGQIAAYRDLEKAISENGARRVTLKEGDSIRQAGSVLKVLGPGARDLTSKELNDTCIVLLLESGGLRALYTGDIGFEIESRLAARYDLDADLLKVGHHGSRFSSSKEFLEEVDPALAVIEVGKNSYGHPTKQALANLAGAGSRVFRTDLDGTVRLFFDGEVIRAYK